MRWCSRKYKNCLTAWLFSVEFGQSSSSDDGNVDEPEWVPILDVCRICWLFRPEFGVGSIDGDSKEFVWLSEPIKEDVVFERVPDLIELFVTRRGSVRNDWQDLLAMLCFTRKRCAFLVNFFVVNRFVWDERGVSR